MRHRNRKNVREAVHLFKSIASPTRLRIVDFLLNHGPVAVQDIAAGIKMTHSAVSHQLAHLSGAQIVKHAKVGREKHYSIAETKPGLAIVSALQLV
ncbi:ArsR/SmtB family transcription factor [Bradyrhizobium elkanii]|uniref:ArsR/SmtB family transcription factor n=1 Tax=Bradyrhizobium elkanii TaxID=29448 RepID=UPI003D1C8346